MAHILPFGGDSGDAHEPPPHHVRTDAEHSRQVLCDLINTLQVLMIEQPLGLMAVAQFAELVAGRVKHDE